MTIKTKPIKPPRKPPINVLNGLQFSGKGKSKPKKIVDNRLIFLDLGCGQNKNTPESLFQNGLISEGDKNNVKIIGIDNQKIDGIDLAWDLTKFPYPFDDASIDGAISSHFLEHLDGPQRIQFFNEMYRILKMGGKMRHIHPYYKSSRAVQDPTHKFPPICEESYLYWDKNWRQINKLEHYLGDCDYEFSVYYTFMDNTWMTKNEETRNHAIRHFFNVVADMIVDMKKR